MFFQKKEDSSFYVSNSSKIENSTNDNWTSFSQSVIEKKVPNENPFEYEDKDILEKGMNNGFTYLLEKINNETYNDLKYVD